MAFVCTNADEGDKVKCYISRKFKNLCRFCLGPPIVRYFCQKNAWSDATFFRSWFSALYLHHVRRKVYTSGVNDEQVWSIWFRAYRFSELG